MNNSILVSVICTAYNQEKYIQKAIESMVSQKTTFEYEIIIHDDCSTDGTKDIVKFYADKYPSLIRTIVQEENQYSKGIDVFRRYCLPLAQGDYIAICEGDDYWIGDDKLQTQYEILHEHVESDMCACGAVAVSANDLSLLYEIAPKEKHGVLSVEEIILGGGRYIATAGLFFRKSLLKEMMNFERVISFDYTMQIKGAFRGGIIYIAKQMAAYRVFADNSWTKMVEADKEKKSMHLKKEIAMLRELDRETNYVYHEIIDKRIAAYTPFIVQLKNHKEEILKEIGVGSESIYMWGLGLRGGAALEFFEEVDVHLDGVCDIRNENVGECNKFGIKIEHTDYVLKRAQIIIATNQYVYESLQKSNFGGLLINLQKYMPLS